ncbi:hypothetical protein CTA1_8096 [Colletotrichum tanaceti]|uniref:Uncharacterized protein n=1 Tax=Colletotrichum tanaceti TaxID=1306861 RepID=A0A4U6XED9_9PEZI|nr:hypothetical protein CTA1_8096 [Colletotrichum tanaceti]
MDMMNLRQNETVDRTEWERACLSDAGEPPGARFGSLGYTNSAQLVKDNDEPMLCRLSHRSSLPPGGG